MSQKREHIEALVRAGVIPKSRVEAAGQTEPGRLARLLNELLYCAYEVTEHERKYVRFPRKFGLGKEDDADAGALLSDVRDYLETMAMAEALSR